MCLMVFAHRVHPRYPFIFASNRDEFYNRPAKEAHFWPDHPGLLAGKDLKAGGTWMGVNKEGRFAALTNYRNIPEVKKNALSRGDLVTGYLRSGKDPGQFLRSLADTAGNYNGFNLLTGHSNELWYMNNKQLEVKQVEPGYHSLSNAFLNTSWPKTDSAMEQFKETVGSTEEPDHEKLFQILKDDRTYPREMLPDTGLSDEMEVLVSSIFITSPEYGTRCSTLFFIDQEGNRTFHERTFRGNSGDIESDVSFTF